MELKFSEEYHRCVFDGLKNTLGESGMSAVLFDIESRRCIEDARILHDKLYGIFGDGALLIEKVIVKELCRRLHVSYEEPKDFDFARSVDRIRDLFKTGRQSPRAIE